MPPPWRRGGRRGGGAPAPAGGPPPKAGITPACSGNSTTPAQPEPGASAWPGPPLPTRTPRSALKSGATGWAACRSSVAASALTVSRCGAAACTRIGSSGKNSRRSNGRSEANCRRIRAPSRIARGWASAIGFGMRADAAANSPSYWPRAACAGVPTGNSNVRSALSGMQMSLQTSQSAWAANRTLPPGTAAGTRMVAGSRTVPS
jgi:hypothetical protein